ncbi:MAG TPA: hypothetical protein VGP62_14735 [Bryobacteraceae bacterium]|jgi:uncharacterized protein (TIGR03437 family)|nr:hypothetical protein [Bryobacteraceae bacterium]
MHRHSWRHLVGFLSVAWYHYPAAAQTLQWARQFASPPAAAFSVASDSSGVYMAGITYKALPGQTKISPSGTQPDGYVRKYDPAGNELWTQEFAVLDKGGLSVNGIAVDSTGVYVAAKTGGGSRYGIGPGTLAVVYKFDPDGNLLWTHQTTTSKTLPAESAAGIALNGGTVYVVGLTESVSGTSAYLRKLDPSAGTEVWTSTFVNSNGINGIHPYSVAADASGAYVVGSTPGPLSGQPAGPGQDLFIRKYDPSGNALWTNQFGTPNGPEYAEAVSVSSSGVYVAGTTPGLLGIQTLPTFAYDAYVRKYDANGNLQWTRQFGTADNDVAYGAFADDTGMYVVGYTKGVLGTASLGGADVFLRRYDSNGNALWTLQTGSVDDDYGYGVAADASGIYIAGYTDRNSIPESLTNVADPFLYKYSPPAPGGPVILDGGIVNNASFATSPAPVAPGSIAAIFGTGLNDGSQVLFSSFGPDGTLVTALGGASVTVGTVPAPMFYSTSGQLGIQIPVELDGQASADVQVTVGGQTSQVQTVNLTSVRPGLFTVSQDGRGTAVCLHTDGVTPVTADLPANPGEVVIFYGTGFGPVDPPLGTGAPSSGNQITSAATMTIDGLSAEIQFAGIAPGFVGLNQINVVVPGLARTNAADPVVLTIDGVPANPVTLPVGTQ